ncbi:2-oxoisovalerate dehydrogenase E1 subunit beta [Methylovulum miyakonense]|uniref:2-oxoisovalerate dehydrogenase E1 subunit beta n=1 Tax=Methylovulum miyakonense TaxID=645578 RepID=UPI00035F3322|nr:2-oxoisovalerate dehydrogenase E1 subunit beta [Methylovulum miyakonense]
MNEIIFLVEEAPEGGFIAKALGASIFTQADDISELHQSLREAIDCHFEPMDKPKIIRLHFVREEVIAA